MDKYKHEHTATGFNGETGSNAGAALSEAGSARRSFLGRIGRRGAALAMFGLGGETWLQAFSNRSIMSGAVAEGASVSLLPPTLLFASNFEGNVQFGAPYGCGSTSCWQDIVGTDPTTGFNWADFRVLNGTAAQGTNTPYCGHLITGVSGTSAGYIGQTFANEVQTTTGRLGTQTRAARFRNLKNENGNNQNVFGYWPWQSSPERLYWRFWLKLESDLAQRLGPNSWTSFWAWKTAGGDYRLTSQIWTNNSSVLFWNIQGDNEANFDRPYQRYFRLQNNSVPVPVGQWFKVEVFFDRNGNGRVWQAINGAVVFDRVGSLYGVDNARLREGTFLTVRAAVPVTRDVWLDEFEVWDNFPPASSNSPVPPNSPGGIEVTESPRIVDPA